MTRLLLTHAHPDHIGGAAHVARETGLGMGVHAGDAGYVRTGTEPPQVAVGLLGRLLHLVTPDLEPEPIPSPRSSSTASCCRSRAGCRVVHMPGHSPGHVGFLHEPSGVLRDRRRDHEPGRPALVTEVGRAADFRMSQRTAHRLGELDYRVAAFTHGPEVRDQPREKVRRFLVRHGYGG